MILGLAENSVQILDASHYTHGHFTAIGWCLWAWIQCCPESFAYFLDTGLQLIALEEDDEHGLEDLVTLSCRFTIKSMKMEIQLMLFKTHTFDGSSNGDSICA